MYNIGRYVNTMVERRRSKRRELNVKLLVKRLDSDLREELDISVLNDYMVSEFGEKAHDKQIKKINKEKIYYGGQPINKIFDNNFFNGKIQSGVDIYYTFKAKDVFLPISTPENVEKTIINIEGLKGLSNQSLRMYLSDDKNDTYKKFNDIIDGKVFDWENENTTQIVNMDDAVITEEKEYFLKIINEEYRELSFSNLLAYFLKNKKVMLLFAEQVLKLKNFNSNAYSIAREEKNIDLFISSPEHYIIIENKIRSGLIEEKKDMSKKILEYFDENNEKKLPSKAKELINAFKQVENYYRYYAYACGMVEKQKNNANISGYVLFPNYALHSITQQLQNALFSENYTPITYKQVYSFFGTLKDRNVLNASESKYLDEFLKAMEIHTKEVDNIFEEEMKNRFYKKIKSSEVDISPLC